MVSQSIYSTDSLSSELCLITSMKLSKFQLSDAPPKASKLKKTPLLIQQPLEQKLPLDIVSNLFPHPLSSRPLWEKPRLQRMRLRKSVPFSQMERHQLKSYKTKQDIIFLEPESKSKVLIQQLTINTHKINLLKLTISIYFKI